MCQTARDQTQAETATKPKQEIEIEVSSDDEVIEPPRSASVPIAKWVEG